MAGKGPPPKPANLRQRTNKKAGSGQIFAPESPMVRPIPNPDERVWHPLTIAAWNRAWESPMASQWLETDADGLGRLALLWDDFYKRPGPNVMAEIRLQETRFGLSPLDRSRLQWEVDKGEQAKQRMQQRQQPARRVSGDPRAILKAVK